MNKIHSIDQLVKAARKGYHVKCPGVTDLEKYVKAEDLMPFSIRGIQKAIDSGLFCKELVEVTDQLDILADAKARIHASGLSYQELSKRLSVSIQAVSKFMRASSVSTRTLGKYLKAIK